MGTLRGSRVYCGVVACLLTCTLRAGILDSPNAAQLQGPFFVQPFAFVTVDSVTGGVGQTSSFFSSLPPGSYPTFQVVNILGNFQAFDSMGDPVTTFDITGVSVTQGSNTFTPAFGLLNFAGMPSVTFTDALNPLNTATYSATDFTFAFTFTSDPSLTYSYTLNTTGLDAGSTLVSGGETEATVPEPRSFWLLGAVLVVLYRSKKYLVRV
jgi:hypothetical protein